MSSDIIYQINFSIKTELSQTQLGLFNDSLQDYFLSISTLIDSTKINVVCVTNTSFKEEEFLSFLQKILPANEIVLNKINDFTIKEINQKTNWLQESYEALPSFEIGNFFIYGTHHIQEVLTDKIPLMVDAVTAFGSGSHGTTSGCLNALEYLKNLEFKPNNILDLGTGSGILSIAAEKLWDDAKITATDIDEESIVVTNRHLEKNNSTNIDAFQSDGFENSKIEKNSPYDLIIANILAGPLKELSVEIIEHTKNKGMIILSGLLIEQEDEIISHYINDKTALEHSIHIDEWATLIIKKN